MTHTTNTLHRPALLPQNAYRVAVARAVEALQRQSPEQIAWLGATDSANGWEIPVLGQRLSVRLPSGDVLTPQGETVRPNWQVLVLHYLGVRGRPAPELPQITFADLAGGRGYAGVYRKRTVERLCATAGRTCESICAAAASVGGRRTAADPLAFRFDVFPRLSVGLVWHAADEEFPAEATWLLPPNIDRFLPIEDIVVLCESCVSRLEGKSF